MRGMYYRGRNRLRLIYAIGAVALVITSGVIPVSRSYAHAPGYSVHPAGQWKSFIVRGTHRFLVLVTLERGHARLEAISRGATVSYEAPVAAHHGVVHARWGKIGAMTMRFVARGPREVSKEPQGDCRGKRALVQQGTFRGHFTFAGERSFTRASIRSVSGLAVQRFREVCHGDNAGLGADDGVLTPIFAARRKTPTGRVELKAYRLGPRAGLEAGVIEVHPQLSVERWIWSFGPSVVINGEDTGEILVEGEPPFSGRAEVRSHDESSTWEGDLACSFPGRGMVALAGSQFRVDQRWQLNK
jgi:hypothetical protein